MKSLGLSVGIKMIPKRVFLWDQVSFSLLIIMTGFRKGYLLSHFKQKILEIWEICKRGQRCAPWSYTQLKRSFPWSKALLIYWWIILTKYLLFPIAASSTLAQQPWLRKNQVCGRVMLHQPEVMPSPGGLEAMILWFLILWYRNTRRIEAINDSEYDTINDSLNLLLRHYANNIESFQLCDSLWVY